MDKEEFRKRMQEKMKENRKAFEGEYSTQLNELMGLSKEEIDSVTPDTTDMQIYRQLISVVEEASAVNLAQAALKENIIDLGEVAVKLASKVPSLASLFV